NVPKRMQEFVNTWSVDGFVSEGSQPAELGWGTHEKAFPTQGRRHEFGCQSAIYLMQPGAGTRVRTWTPQAGHFHGFLITHGESISISDYFTLRNGDEVIYRPTVHYAYHPCDDAVLSVHEFAGHNWRLQETKRILNKEIIDGIDELGVLLAGHKKNAYWYGSQLSIHEARNLVPHNTATSLQVCVAVLSCMVWAIENPLEGIVEPEEMDVRRNLEICMTYLGPVVGEYSNWTPLLEECLLVRLAAFDSRGPQSRPTQHCDEPAGVRGGVVVHGVGHRESAGGYRRAGRDGRSPKSRNLHDLPRTGRRRILELDAPSRRMPISTARSFRFTRPAISSHTTLRRACRCAWRCCRAWCGPSRIRWRVSSSRMRWTFAAISKSACPTSDRSSANTRTGRRFSIASVSSPRISTRAIRGNSRM